MCVCALLRANTLRIFFGNIVEYKVKECTWKTKIKNELLKHNKAECEIKILPHTHTFTYAMTHAHCSVCVCAKNLLCLLDSSQIDICWPTYSFGMRISFTVHELLLFHCVFQWQVHLKKKRKKIFESFLLCHAINCTYKSVGYTRN